MKLNYLVPILGVADVQRSIDFYQETLGFEVMNTYAPEGKLCWAMVKSGDTRLMFSLSEPGRKEKDVLLYFYPDNVVELHFVLRSRGHRVSGLRVTFYGMKEFDFADPDGYPMTFGEHTHDPPTEE